MTTSTGDISAVLASLRASLLCGLERAVELSHRVRPSLRTP
jgi:hypothetical protein